MPLRTICPPALVHVRDVDGVLRPALLLAERDGRSYLQVSRRCGDNVLRWLPSADVGAPSADAGAAAAGHSDGGSPGPGAQDGPVRLRLPRSSR